MTEAESKNNTNLFFLRGSRISLSNHCDALKTLCTQRIKEPALWKKKKETEQGMKIRKSSNFYGKETKITLAGLYLMKKWVKNGSHAPQTSTPIQFALLDNTPFVSSRHKGSINTKDTS